MNSLRPRGEYAEHLKRLGDRCALCAMDANLIIAEYSQWTWVFAAFPYRKYHTLLVTKRHTTMFSDLTPDELTELGTAVGSLERQYLHSGIVKKGSPFGDQLYMAWRLRGTESEKKPVSHLHLHAYPRFALENDESLKPDAWDIDISLLKHTL